MTADRAVIREQWVHAHLGSEAGIEKLAGDASFRSYYRVRLNGVTYVLMDAPPEHEDVKPFLAVREWFERTGIRVSHLVAEDVVQGFLLLEDFGDHTWASHLRQGGDVEPLFADALRQLHLLQASGPGIELPLFDMARMRRECDLYLDWYLPRVAGHTPTPGERQAYHDALSPLLAEIEALPRVPVHLDFHSRNLMLPAGRLPLGMIDYQDAVTGPVTYDLASLLYDCYQDYPEMFRCDWSRRFFETLPVPLRDCFDGFEAWHRLLRLTAMQRHLKAIGIFARLAHRDGKLQFLGEIPLTRKHLCEEMLALGLAATDFPLLAIGPAEKVSACSS